MGIYSNSIIEESSLIDDEFDFDALDEACTISFLSRLPDEDLQEFVQSEECEALITEGKLNRKTIMKLNKNNDLTRRQTLAAYQRAKEKNDSNWVKFVKYKTLANKYKRAILEKYGKQSVNIAKKSQRDYVSGKGKEAAVRATIESRRKKELESGRAGRI